ncbi:MAG: membrane integrity-associated transporter subunit PqiC [Candidatus Tectimicrobiota bacterium]
MPSLWPLLLAACLFGLVQCKAAPSPRLYLLEPLSPLSLTSPGRQRPGTMTLGVGPVELPHYTNRPAIVTGHAPAEVQRAFAEQWAEPLQENFTRVLAENLSRLLGVDRVWLFPWKSSAPHYQVVVEVTHFLGDLGGEVSLVALWSILGQESGRALISQKFTAREATGTSGYAPLALAMSRAVAALSQDIAAALALLPAP